MEFAISPVVLADLLAALPGRGAGRSSGRCLVLAGSEIKGKGPLLRALLADELADLRQASALAAHHAVSCLKMTEHRPQGDLARRTGITGGGRTPHHTKKPAVIDIKSMISQVFWLRG
jgi:hypothetical protein